MFTTLSRLHADPLRALTVHGQSLGGIDPSTVAPEVKRALANGAPVPGCVQNGPTCGLYATEMDMDAFHDQNARNADPLVEPQDLKRADSHGDATYTTGFLLQTAMKSGFTTKGEMFYAANVLKLAQDFGYQGQVITPLTLQGIQAAVNGRHHPVLVPFDVDMVGNPGLYNGTRAHWCVVEGTFNKGDVDYVVAKHGWQLADLVWRANDLIQSSQQLKISNFPAAPQDISGILANRMVEFWPADSTSPNAVAKPARKVA